MHFRKHVLYKRHPTLYFADNSSLSIIIDMQVPNLTDACLISVCYVRQTKDDLFSFRIPPGIKETNFSHPRFFFRTSARKWESYHCSEYRKLRAFFFRSLFRMQRNVYNIENFSADMRRTRYGCQHLRMRNRKRDADSHFLNFIS